MKTSKLKKPEIQILRNMLSYLIVYLNAMSLITYCSMVSMVDAERAKILFVYVIPAVTIPKIVYSFIFSILNKYVSFHEAIS